MSVDAEYLKRVGEFLTNSPFTDITSGSRDYIGGIVGGEEPSRYSQSPLLWNGFFTGLGVNAFFGAFDLPPQRSLSLFTRTLIGSPGCIDLTVTSPYKSAAYEVLASLPGKVTITDRVHHLRSLNHIIPGPAPGEYYVDSTDGMGMFLALTKRRDLESSRVLLVGAGGAAASIGYELVRAGARLFIANIIEPDAQSLADRLSRFVKPGTRVQAGGWESVRKEAPQSDVIISAITVSTPLEEKDMDRLPPECLLADTRYGGKAEFAAAAGKAGRPCIDGREMLFGQFYFAAERVGNNLGIEKKLVEKVLRDVENTFLTS